MSIDGFTCKIKVQPLAEWVEKIEEGGQCPPCLMAPLASFYAGTLKDRGQEKLVQKLQAGWDVTDIPTLAKTMDEIKKEAPSAVRDELLELDCLAQQEGAE